ncbi:hypothetical protein VB774_06905 [Pseudanabaena galeata UHCC 0370]|uniref:NlpC/P60 domain-containing protein n=1 Tax=Pseudanabaena galeata UHCC 0370 TaxID=3110310 RepID=A0ABU5TGI9_9CYAN|nr:hypothetical protein [Pseudanabaena galeata]MEA5477345.1 hypothetical protein [Pseudanabaena galeata UHCC 0370]
MDKSAPQSTSKPILNRGFIVTLGILAVIATMARPSARWVKAQYDIYQANNTVLTASENNYKELIKSIEANQPNKSLKIPSASSSAISEKIFQAALLPDILGRSSRYEPYTSNGTLACARMVNMTIERALGYQVGQNTLYVPSMVEDLDNGKGKRIDQNQSIRGDIAISNGTDYEKGLWHIGICMNDGCSLVLSNSPFKSEFSWLTNSNFDGAFDRYPGKTTFYRIVQK